MMGWEVRKNGRYYYRVFKRDGRTVRQYVGRERGAFGWAIEVLMQDRDRRERAEREARRKASAELRARVDGLLRETAEANAEMGGAAEALLLAAGYHRPNRGGWRMKRVKGPSAGDDKREEPMSKEGEQVSDRRAKGRPPAAEALGPVAAERPPAEPAIPTATDRLFIEYHAPANVPGAAALFARVRAGDQDAVAELRAWLRDRKQVDWYGDLGMRATCTLADKFTGGDPVWRTAVEEKVKALRQELLGPTPTALDQLLVRRILNAWLAVHALELELAVRPPARPRDRAYLEAAVGRASKRMTQAVTELARVRRLKLPPVLVSVTPPPPLAKPILPAGG